MNSKSIPAKLTLASAAALAAAFGAAPVASADVIVLRDGLNGYDGTADTTLASDTPATSISGSVGIFLDGDDPADPADRIRQGLIRFDLSAIPADATINSAQLTLSRGPNGGFANVSVFDLTADFPINTATFNSTGNGIQVGTETAPTALGSAGLGSNGSVTIDVTSAVAADAADASVNRGFALIAGPTNTFLDIVSSESTNFGARPTLTVDFTPAAPVPEPAATAVIGAGAGALVLRRRRRA